MNHQKLLIMLGIEQAVASGGWNSISVNIPSWYGGHETNVYRTHLKDARSIIMAIYRTALRDRTGPRSGAASPIGPLIAACLVKVAAIRSVSSITVPWMKAPAQLSSQLTSPKGVRLMLAVGLDSPSFIAGSEANSIAKCCRALRTVT